MLWREWLDSQPRGTQRRIREREHIGWATLSRAQRGLPVEYHTAKKLIRISGFRVALIPLVEGEKGKR